MDGLTILRESRRSMNPRILLIIGLIVLTIVIGIGIVFLGGDKAKDNPEVAKQVQVKEMGPPPPPPPPPKVVIAAKDIPSHSIVSEDLFTTKVMPKPWSGDFIPSGEMPSLRGRITRTKIEKGQPLLDDYFYKGQKFSYLIPSNLRAVPIGVSYKSSVLQMVKPGDIVDVMCIFPPSYTEQYMTKTIVQAVKVLSVGTKWLPDHLAPPPAAEGSNPPPPPGGGQNNPEQGYNAIVLGVSPADAEKITLAEQVGSIQLLLRGEDNKTRAYTLGAYKSTVIPDDFNKYYMSEKYQDRYEEEVTLFKGTGLKKTIPVTQGPSRKEVYRPQ